jgi:hypothetical protein
MEKILLKCSCIVALFLGTVFSLPAQQSVGYLKVEAHPHRTGVFVDNKYLGPAANFGTTRKYAVALGEHEVELREPLSEDFAIPVQIEAGETTTIRETMKPLAPPKPPFGTLRIKEFDKYAAVYINGRFVGHKDEFDNSLQGLLLNPGQYEVKVVPTNGAAPVSEQVTIEANKATTLRGGLSKP